MWSSALTTDVKRVSSPGRFSSKEPASSSSRSFPNPSQRRFCSWQDVYGLDHGRESDCKPNGNARVADWTATCARRSYADSTGRSATCLESKDLGSGQVSGPCEIDDRRDAAQ